MRSWSTPRFCRWALALALLPLSGLLSARAQVPVTPETAAVAAQVAKPAVSLLKDVVAIPMAVAQTMRLPMGVVEVLLFPLPGLSLIEGLRDIGAGILGPFKLVYSVLKLPVSAVKTVDDLLSVAPAAG